MESAPTPGAGAAAKVAGKIPKIVKATKATGKAGKAAGVAQAGGKVVEKGGEGVKYITPKSINQLDTLVRKGQAPKSIRRFDQEKLNPYTLVEHVHFKDGSALRRDGVWHYGSRNLTNEEIKFLKTHGWKIPE